MNGADLFVWGCIILSIIIKIAYDKHNERKAAKYRAWRASIWHTVRKCNWCRATYRIEDGDPYVCSPKCKHQQSTAWRQYQTR